MVDIVGLLQNPQFMSAASMLLPNEADRSAIQNMAQMNMQMKQHEQKQTREAAEEDLLNLRRQTLQHELGQKQRRSELGQQLGGLLSQPGYDQQQALGLLAEMDPMQAMKMAGIGETGPMPFEGLSKRGVEGWSQAALARAELKRRRGEPLTDEEEIAIQTAQHSLTQPQIMTAPGGGLLERTPGLPSYAVPPASLLGQSGQTLPPDSPSQGAFYPQPGGLRSIAPPVHQPSRGEILRADTMERAKGARSFVNETRQAAETSRRSAARMERGIDLLGKVRTGTGADVMLDLKKVAGAMGVDIDMTKVANEEELRTILGAEVMNTVSQTKGAVSEKEMDLFQQFSASSGKTNQGNRQILEFGAAVERRNVEKANMVRQMQRDGATSIEIQYALEDFMEANDLGEILSTPAQAAGPATGQIRFLGFE